MVRFFLLIAAVLFVGSSSGALALLAQEPCAPACADEGGGACCPEACACCVHHLPARLPAPSTEVAPTVPLSSPSLRGVDEDAPRSPDPPRLLHVPKA